VIAIPEDEVLSVDMSAVGEGIYTLTSDNVTLEVGVEGDEDLHLWPDLPLDVVDAGLVFIPVGIHFSSPGTSSSASMQSVRQ